MNLKISIISVCYNSSETILDTIRSVNSQSYPHIEHIFIDGLSTDNTLECVRGLKNKIKPLILRNNKEIVQLKSTLNLLEE